MADFPPATHRPDRHEIPESTSDPATRPALSQRGRSRRSRTVVLAALVGLVATATGTATPPPAAAAVKKHRARKVHRARVAARVVARPAAASSAAAAAPSAPSVSSAASAAPAPAAAGAAAPTDATAASYLALTNEARAQARSCGSVAYAAAPPVQWDARLAQVAMFHAQEQLSMGVLSHAGADGSDPGTRVSRVGYVWDMVGENVAWGQPDAGTVMRDWLASPAHCANIMDPRLRDMGMAQVGAYWSQELGDPR